MSGLCGEVFAFVCWFRIGLFFIRRDNLDVGDELIYRFELNTFIRFWYEKH